MFKHLSFVITLFVLYKGNKFLTQELVLPMPNISFQNYTLEKRLNITMLYTLGEV
jgi:hypothetical protein